MALTKAQISLVTVSTLGVAAGGYTAQLQAFNTQKEAAAFIASAGLLNAGTNAEYALEVAKNIGVSAGSKELNEFFKALENGASRADATVDFANAQLVAGNKTLEAGIKAASTSGSTSTDLTELKAVVAPVTKAGTTVTFTDIDADQSTVTGNNQTIGNIGKAQLDANQAKISADFTFELKNQIGENETYAGKFLSPMLERAAAENSNSTIYVKLLDGFAERDGLGPVDRSTTNGFGFSLDGANIIVISDKIGNATTYDELNTAIDERIKELAAGENLPAGADPALYAKLVNFTVTLGDKFTKINQDGKVVTGTAINITDTEGRALKEKGFSKKSGIQEGSDNNIIEEISTKAPAVITQAITTNLDADNVGYGSQGATLNIAGQSASDKGIETLKVTATNGVWFTQLKSEAATNHLSRIELQAGSDDYFRVGTQASSKVNTHVVNLVDQNFNKAGLVDVREVDASATAGSTAINAYVSKDVIARDYNLKDTGSFGSDDKAISFNLSAGRDVVNLAVDQNVMAATDTKVSINTGSGSDVIHFQVSNGLNANGTIKAAGNGNWLTNQQELKNLVVNAGDGDDQIVMSGAGNAVIDAGTGNDEVRADNTGDRAVFLFNNGNLTELDHLSNSMNSNSSTANGVQQDGYKLFKATVTVEFLGFKAFAQVESTDYKTSTLQINQAIKKAIADSPQLSKLLAAHDNAGKALGLESLVDGVLATNDLKITVVAPKSYDANETEVNKALREADGQQMLTSDDLLNAAKFVNPNTTTAEVIGTLNTAASSLQTIYATDYAQVNGANVTGTNSSAESDNIINLGQGTDLVMMGTGAHSNDTLKLTGYNNGVNTIVNFDKTAGTGKDYLDFSQYVGKAPLLWSGIASATGALTHNSVTKTSVAKAADFAKLTASEIVAQLNDDYATDTTKKIAGLSGIDAATNTKDPLDATKDIVSHYVLMVQNGTTEEYKIFHLTADAVSDTKGKFASNAQEIGTLDFGTGTVNYSTATLTASVDAFGALSFDTAGLTTATNKLTVKVENKTAGVDTLTLSATEVAKLQALGLTDLTFNFKELGANGDVVKVAAGSTATITNLTVTGGTLDISAAAGFVVTGTTTLNSQLILSVDQLKAFVTAGVVIDSGSDTASGVQIVVKTGETIDVSTLNAVFTSKVSLTVAAGSDTSAAATVTNDLIGFVGSAVVATGPIVDTTAPTFTSAATSTDGKTIVLTYGEDLDETNIPATTDFTVSDNTVSGVAVSGKTVTLTVGTTIVNGATVTVGYTDPTTGNDANAIQDAAGNDAITITAKPVTNNVVVVDAVSVASDALAVAGTYTGKTVTVTKGTTFALDAAAFAKLADAAEVILSADVTLTDSAANLTGKVISGAGDVTVTDLTTAAADLSTITATGTKTVAAEGVLAATTDLGDFAVTTGTGITATAAQLDGLAVTGAGTVTVTAAGTEDLSNITVSGNVEVTATVSADAKTIDLSGVTGKATVTGSEGVDTITVGNGGSTIEGGVGADVITLGAGADKVVFIAEAASTTFDAVTGAATGDIISFGGTANGTAAFTSVGVAWDTDLATTLAAAVAGDGSTDSAVKWFIDTTDAYLVVDNSADATFVDGTDALIKLVGVTDLSGASFFGADLTLA